MFETSLLGRKVEFGEGARTFSEVLVGKTGTIVCAYMNGSGTITYQVEVDGALYIPSLVGGGFNGAIGKILPPEK